MAAGRKSKYETHVEPYLDLVKSMRIDGHTEEQIYKKLGVNHNSFNNYKNKYIELNEALKYSKEILIAKLEQTLFQQAMKGNTTALIFSLKNLHPKKWGEKIDVTGDLELKSFGVLLDKFIDKL
jgi:hypothetical protein